jgi:uncharacterized protein DUF6594
MGNTVGTLVESASSAIITIFGINLRANMILEEEALIRQRTIAAMEDPSKYDLHHLHKYLVQIGLPLEGTDSTIWGNQLHPHDRAPDLICLRPRQKEDAFSTWVVDKAIKWFMNCFHHRMRPSKSIGLKGVADETLLRLTHWITTIIASVLPSISIIVLYCIKSTWGRLGALVGFNILLSVCLAAFTKATRSDIFEISAAYVYFTLSNSFIKSQLICVL